MAQTAQRILLFVGTYTRHVGHVKGANGRGIHSFSLDLDTGMLTEIGVTEGIDNPSYLAIDAKHEHLYAVSEVGEWDEGTISAYTINTDTAALTYINKQPTLGGSPAFVSVDGSDQYVLLTNYSSGQSAVMLPIRSDGGLAPASDSVKHEGSGADPERQESPHPHSIVSDPGNRYALVPDLGIDRIMSYRFDLEEGKLVPNAVPGVQLNPASGPRHMVFHPNGRYAYVIQEISSQVTALAYDSASGTLEPLHTVSTLPTDFSGANKAGDIQITPSGTFVYASNRGHDSLAIFAVDETNGRLSFVAHQSTNGESPRGIAIDPTGTYLLAGNHDSHNIVTWRINPQTGLLDETQNIPTPTPVCLKLIAV